MHAESHGIYGSEKIAERLRRRDDLEIASWRLGASLATELVAVALQHAIEARRPDGKQLCHHSDRGCQYTSDAYQQTLRMLGITCWMSRTGNCYDAAAMECFVWSLKHEWTKLGRATSTTLDGHGSSFGPRTWMRS